jgi:hypothetical protein
MPENSRRGVAVVQWPIVDSPRSMSWVYFLANIPMTGGMDRRTLRD